jgi:hypothetical protein
LGTLDSKTGEFVSKVNPPLLARESIVRSSAVIGDFNGDGSLDLITGYPYFSLCLVYLGKNEIPSRQFSDLVVSFNIFGPEESEFGWAVSGLGDINKDHCDDLMISAKGIGVIYIILGKISSISKDIYVDRLSSQEGYKIVGSQTVFNLGMSISNAGDFNKDGYPDIIFSGMSAKNSFRKLYLSRYSFRFIKHFFYHQTVDNHFASF